MNIADIVAALRRRWYLVIAVVVLAGAAAYGAWSVVPAAYERTATQLMLPGAGEVPEGANPYLYVGGLFQIADILVRAVGPEQMQPVVEKYPGVSIEVGRDPIAGAVLTVTVTASTDAAAAAALDQMLEVTQTTLADLQDAQRIPPEEQISIMPLTTGTQSTVVQKTRLMMTGLAGAAIAVLGLVLIVVVDQLLRYRRQKRRAGAAADDAAGEPNGAASAAARRTDATDPTVEGAMPESSGELHDDVDVDVEVEAAMEAWSGSTSDEPSLAGAGGRGVTRGARNSDAP